MEQVPLTSYSDIGIHLSDSTEYDSGACLGVDFGGTLSKIVFFEPAVVEDLASDLTNFFLGKDKYGDSGVRDTHLSFYSDRIGGRIHFINFETSQTSGAIKMLSSFKHNIRRVQATGGGAFKFAETIKQTLGINMMKRDELETVVRGIIFTLLEHPESECYSYEAYHRDGTRSHDGIHFDALSYQMKKVPRPMPASMENIFPFLVVNIGSGVSIIKVDSPGSFKRISGTAIGGATYYGLCKLLCRCESYGQAMDLAERGDSRDVNLRVQDIYGGSYEQIGLSGEITASFFGKAAATKGHVRSRRSNKLPVGLLLEALCLVIIALLFANLLANLSFIQKIAEVSPLVLFREFLLMGMPFGIAAYVFRSSGTKLGVLVEDSLGRPTTVTRVKKTTLFDEADIARALVVMVAQNVTQIAFLNAKLHNSQRVIFTGNFLRHNKIALRALTSMMYTWSQGDIEALFMEHEGYFGAIGAFLHSFQREHPSDEEEDIVEEELPSNDDEAPVMDTVRTVVSDLLYEGRFPRRRSVV